MNKHTPGPWLIEVNGFIIAPDGFSVADCDRGRDVNEADANARLIAAAPDMLMALKNIRKYIEYCDHEPALDEIDAAIAKAEGSHA